LYKSAFNFLSAVCYLTLTFISGLALAQKTDKILLDNNDWITGEIKQLDYGKVSFKTSAAGTIQIKWDRIYQIRSDKYFEISVGRGEKYYGSLDVTEEDEKYKILVIQDDEEVVLDMNRIVEMTQIKGRFWTRIDGNLDLGYSYTKASDVKQWNSSFRVDYRPTNSLTTLTGNSIYTLQPERDPASKQDFNISYKYFTSGNFAYSGFSALQQNSELGLNLRTLLGFGMSKNWLRSNIQRFITTLGFLVNQENYSDGTDSRTNYEGLVRLEYRIFRYRDPEINVTSYFDFYPSFTVPDRYRTDLDIQIKYEVFNNFYFSVSFYHNLDTKPPEGAQSTSDWGITTSIGFTF